MDDVIATWISPEHLREWTVAANVVAALFIGPYLAFAATPDASFRCLQAFIRMLHRIVLVGFSLALMNNAMVLISNTERVPTGAALAINLCILLSVAISALRYRYWMSDIPHDATWRHPHFVHRETNKERAISVASREG